MKTRLLILLSSLFFFYNISVSQIYSTTSNNGQTITTCKGNFQQSGTTAFACSNYGTNLNQTVTFCSGNGGPIRVSFIQWDIEEDFDFLFVYDGPTATGTPIATITGTGDIFTPHGPLAFTSTGTCLTFRFTSDGSVTGCGWDAIIGCPPTACGTNAPAEDFCGAAPQICDLNGYCGNTSGWFTQDNGAIGTTGSSLFCGSIENNSWLSFIASATTATFNITSSNCVVSNSGIQAHVYQTTNCTSFTSKSNCVNQNTGSGTAVLTATALTIGQKYYIMVDGFAGNICDYTVTANTGVQVITLTSNPTNATLCNTGTQTATITVNNAPAGTTFSWNPDPSITSPLNGPSITVNPSVTTTYTCVITLPNGCGIQTENFTITVNQKTNPTFTQLGPYCVGSQAGSLPTTSNNNITGNWNPATVSTASQGTITYTFTPTTGLCANTATMSVAVNPTKQTTLNRTICQGQSVSVGNQTFSNTGTFIITLQSSQQCDSVVTLNLIVNPTKQTTLNRNICQGQSVSVGNQTFNTPGTFVVTLQTSQQCDSVVTLNLTVNPTKQTTLNRTICQGQSVSVGNQTFNSAGIFVVTLQTSLLCDSVVTLNLTVNPIKQTTLNSTICQGQSVTVGNQTFNSNGTFVVTLQTSQQCDSVVTLNLTVNPTIVTNLTRSICQGQSITIGNQTFNTTGNYSVTLQTSLGCDSTVNLNLSVTSTIINNISRTICQGQSVTIGNNVFTQTGNFTVTLVSAAGCDSVVNLNLIVNPTKQTNLFRTICQGQSVTIGNQSFNSTGTFVVTLQTSQQCDSVVTLNLTVNPIKQTTLNSTICQGQSVTVGNQTFNTNGTFVVTLQTSQQCDSVVTLNLTVNPTKLTNLTRSICQGQTVTIGNQTFNTTGNYSVTLQTSLGCDSTVNLNLSVTSTIINNISRTICQGQSFTIGNNVFTQTGNFTVTLASAAGCDSVVNLNLTVNPVKQTTLNNTICQGESVTVGNQIFSSTGTFIVTLQTSQQCDSVVTLNLTVNPTKQTTLNSTICQGQSVTVGNQTFNTAGTFVVTLQTSQQCDSVVTLDLIVNPTRVTNINRTICQGESVTIGNQVFTNTGNFSVVLQTSLGCDSTVNLNLTVNPTKTTSLNNTICQGDSVIVGTQVFFTEGTFTVNLLTSQNCDSTVTLNLIVNPTKVLNLAQVICQGDSVVIDDKIFKESGVYSVVLETSLGCDSIINLTLTALDTSVNTFVTTICAGDSVIIGDQTFTEAGIYIVRLQSSFGCDSTIILDLRVKPTQTTDLRRIICEGESVTVGNQSFSTTGNFTVVLQTFQNCDSTVNLDLTVNPKVRTDLFRIICEGESVGIGNQIFNETGNFTVVLQTVFGCDSTVNLDLVVNSSYTIDITETICQGQSFTVGNQNFTESGNYTINLQTTENCDSVINLDLTVLESVSESIVFEICQGEAIAVGDSIYTSTGIYTTTLVSSSGCDSIVTLELTVNPSISTNRSETICDGESVTIGSQTFTATGNYTVLLTSVSGCDSTVNLSLVVNAVGNTTLNTRICSGQSVTVGQQTFTTSGEYTVVLQNVLGCDSTIFLNLLVNELPDIIATADKPIVNIGEPVQLGITTTETLSYNWTPADIVSNPAIQNPTATLTESTWFVVTATNGQTGCSFTDSVFVELNGLACSKENVYIPNAFTPNGDRINDIFIPRSEILKSMKLIVQDRWGNQVFESNDLNIGWDGIYKDQHATEDAYGYYFVGECQSGEKIIIKGNVTLMR